MKRPSPSLRARALGWLAQREHSRDELRRKLLRTALQACQRAHVDTETVVAVVGDHEALLPGADAPHAITQADCADVRSDLAAQVDRLLDALQADGVLNEQRFIDSRVLVRASGHGARRIEHELARHGLKLPPLQQQRLRDSELQRASELWRRRFGSVAGDERERARQSRFLAARGFGGDVIRRVLASAGSAPDDDAAVDPA